MKTLDQYECILFDVDGVLLDSIGYYVNIIRNVAEILGADKAIDNSFYKKNLGVSFNEWMSNIIPEHNHSKMEPLFLELNKDSTQSEIFKLFPNTIDVLSSIFHAGKKIGLITTKNRNGLDLFLKSNNISSLIHFSVSGDEVKNYKPDPEGINKAIKYFGLPKNRVIFIGDSLHDYEASKNAKIAFIGVTTGVCTEKDWKNISNIDSLKSLIENTV